MPSADDEEEERNIGEENEAEEGEDVEEEEVEAIVKGGLICACFGCDRGLARELGITKELDIGGLSVSVKSIGFASTPAPLGVCELKISARLELDELKVVEVGGYIGLGWHSGSDA